MSINLSRALDERYTGVVGAIRAGCPCCKGDVTISTECTHQHGPSSFKLNCDSCHISFNNITPEQYFWSQVTEEGYLQTMVALFKQRFKGI